MELFKITEDHQSLREARRARSRARLRQERQQFGKRIADFQGIQFMLADMVMPLEAARQLVYVAAAISNCNDPHITFFGAAAECHVSDVAMQITADVLQLLGGYGYTRDFPLKRMMRDAKIAQFYERTNQIQRMVMARQLLSSVLISVCAGQRCKNSAR
jgi:alkylation response protein AidB-like acyl-CoA dehydrogenase